MRATIVASAGVVALTLTAVALAADGSDSPDPVVDYPDAITRRSHRMATAPWPVENAAMPPRHLDETVFPQSLVDRTRFVWGGRAARGIWAVGDVTGRLHQTHAADEMGRIAVANALSRKRTSMFTGRLAQTVHAYPTWSTAIRQAASQFFMEVGGRSARPAARER